MVQVQKRLATAAVRVAPVPERRRRTTERRWTASAVARAPTPMAAARQPCNPCRPSTCCPSLTFRTVTRSAWSSTWTKPSSTAPSRWSIVLPPYFYTTMGLELLRNFYTTGTTFILYCGAISKDRNSSFGTISIRIEIVLLELFLSLVNFITVTFFYFRSIGSHVSLG